MDPCKHDSGNFIITTREFTLARSWFSFAKAVESTEFHDKRGNHYCLVRKERRVEEFLPTDAVLSFSRVEWGNCLHYCQ